MGKSCFFIGKKRSISKNKIHKDDQVNKSKKRWFVRQKSNDSVQLPRENPSAAPPPPSSSPPPPLSPPPLSPPRPYLPSSPPRLSTENRKSKEDEEEHTKEVIANTTAIEAVTADKDIAEDVSSTECVPLGDIETKEDVEEQSEQVLTIPSAMADNVTAQNIAEVVPQMEPIQLENVETKEDDEEQSEQGLTFPSPLTANITVQVTVEVVPTRESPTTKEDEKEQTRQASVIPTAMAADGTVEDSAEVIPATESIPLAGKSSEEIAAVKIQTAYRAYMGRRALRALRELWRLKPSVKGQNVETQSATSTLHSMQTLARVQSDIRHKRNQRICEEQQQNNNNIRQPNKHNKSNKSPHTGGEDWNVSKKSKEQFEASLLLRKEAAERRERALAYASYHQQARNSFSKTPQRTDMDPEDPQWGWRWLEKWMAVRPWETQSRVSNADLHDQNLVKTPARCELTTHEPNLQKTRPQQKARKGTNSSGRIHGIGDNNDDLNSVQSERYNHRHSSVSIGSSLSVKDDHESVSDKPSVKKTSKARASLSIPPGHLASRNINKNVLEKKRPVGSVKKRISFSGMLPAGTRQLADPVNNATVRRSKSERVNQGSKD